MEMKVENEEDRKAYWRDATRRSRARRAGQIWAEDIASGRLIRIEMAGGNVLELRLRAAKGADQ